MNMKFYETKIWLEKDPMSGSISILMQSEGLDGEPFCFAHFNYDYRYTSNAKIESDAKRLALLSGAKEPLEIRIKEFKIPENNKSA